MDITKETAIVATKRSHIISDTDKTHQIDMTDTDHRKETETDHPLQDPVQFPSTTVRQGTAAITKRIRNHTAMKEPNTPSIFTNVNFVKKNMRKEHIATHTQEITI